MRYKSRVVAKRIGNTLDVYFISEPYRGPFEYLLDKLKILLRRGPNYTITVPTAPVKIDSRPSEYVVEYEINE